jgi:carbonic anhydrase
MKELDFLFTKNIKWAKKLEEDNPDFFNSLAEQHSPEYLWIGCSDSRVPANQIVDLQPGEVFVHRNIANIVVHTDLNCLSVIQYAVEVLEVKHIVVCGHYGCGGIQAALEQKDHGLVDNWLRHIKDVARLHESKLKDLNKEEKFRKLCELNTTEQVVNICNTTIIKKAWKNNKKLTVHGWIYDIHNGLLQDLDCCIPSKDKFKEFIENIR